MHVRGRLFLAIHCVHTFVFASTMEFDIVCSDGFKASQLLRTSRQKYSRVRRIVKAAAGGPSKLERFTAIFSVQLPASSY